MLPFNFRKWVAGLGNNAGKTTSKGLRKNKYSATSEKLTVSQLEDRLVPDAYIWQPTTGSYNWAVPANWSDTTSPATGAGYPNAATDTATFPSTINGALTVTLANASGTAVPIAVGSITLNNNASVTIAGSSTGTLSLNTGITETGLSTSTVSAPVILTSNVAFTNSSTGPLAALTVSGAISGTGNITLANNDTTLTPSLTGLTISGAITSVGTLTNTGTSSSVTGESGSITSSITAATVSGRQHV